MNGQANKAQKMVLKPVIYLAGDSTMQSYQEIERPQWGWGELLLASLEPGTEITVSHRSGCPFPKEQRYENGSYIVDNCAMAGRSASTFLAEGRLDDIEGQIQDGDYLLIQFGHNDADAKKPERYVSTCDYPEVLMRYVSVARAAGALPILVSSIHVLQSDQERAADACRIRGQLPGYRSAMESLAQQEKIPFLALGAWSEALCDALGDEAYSLYRDDQVHLTKAGAECYAGLVARALAPVICQPKAEL